MATVSVPSGAKMTAFVFSFEIRATQAYGEAVLQVSEDLRFLDVPDPGVVQASVVLPEMAAFAKLVHFRATVGG